MGDAACIVGIDCVCLLRRDHLEYRGFMALGLVLRSEERLRHRFSAVLRPRSREAPYLHCKVFSRGQDNGVKCFVRDTSTEGVL